MDDFGTHTGQIRGLSHHRSFPNPWLDMAVISMPDTMRNVLYLSEAIFHSNIVLRAAFRRVLSYFLPDFKVTEVSDAEAEEWLDFIKGPDLDLISAIQQARTDKLIYGNSFTSLAVPFIRFLVCPKCGGFWTLADRFGKKRFNWSFHYEKAEFHGMCPNTECSHRGKFRINDLPHNERKGLRVKHWNPHEIELLHYPYSNQVRYLWRIPPEIRRGVVEAQIHLLEDLPLSILEAIPTQKYYRFEPDAIFHMREPTLAGIRNRGWGIPACLVAFRQIFYVQVLQRQCESIALDYVVPLRLISPDAKRGAEAPNIGGDFGATNDLADFRSHMLQVVAEHRQDPADWQVVPFPVQYQLLGAEATQMTPFQLIDQGQDTLLNGLDIPVDFYKGTLTLQSTPAALRLLETSWHHLIHDTNRWLEWFAKQTSRVLNLKPPRIEQTKVTKADDIEAKTLMLQLAMSQNVSMRTALGLLDLDYREEMRRAAEEVLIKLEEQAKVQKQIDNSSLSELVAAGQLPGMGGQQPPQPGAPGGQGQGGQPPQGQQPAAGGAPAGSTLPGQVPDPRMPTTIEEMDAQADTEAQRLEGLDEAQRKSELIALRRKNDGFAAIVTDRLKKRRQQAGQAAGDAMIRQQASQGQQAPAA